MLLARRKHQAELSKYQQISTRVHVVTSQKKLFFMNKYICMNQPNNLLLSCFVWLPFRTFYPFSFFLAQILYSLLSSRRHLLILSLFSYLYLSSQSSPISIPPHPPNHPFQPLFSKERCWGNRLGKCCAVNSQVASPFKFYYLTFQLVLLSLFSFSHTYMGPHTVTSSLACSSAPRALANTYKQGLGGGR